MQRSQIVNEAEDNPMVTYHDFQDLDMHEEEGRDYQILSRFGSSGIAVMAPHGGDIEPGTSELAEAIAGKEHAFYSFEGLKPKGNRNLHLASVSFDESTGVRLAKASETVLTIHGCKKDEPLIFIGGLDDELKSRIRDMLLKRAFPVQKSPNYPGRNPMNICNLGRRDKGVQLEMSSGLRKLLFKDLSRAGRKEKTEDFENLVKAVRDVIGVFAELKTS